MKNVHRIGRRRKSRVMKRMPIMTRQQFEGLDLNSRLSLIQALIPLGMMAVSEELQREVEELAGEPYGRKQDKTRVCRHGSNPGSVKLAGQRVGIEVPRVRNATGEVPLESYQRLHRGTDIDDTLFRRVLYGISCRNYEAAAEALPGAIGVVVSHAFSGTIFQNLL